MRHRRVARNPLLRQRDVQMIERRQLSGKRIALIVVIVLDMCSLAVLFLQLSDTGFPTTMDMLSDSLNESTPNELWFIPLTVAAIFPLLGLLGTILLWQYLLLAYCGYIMVLVGIRLYFLYEAGKREGLDNRDDLLLDMMLLTFGIFLQIYAFQSASTLGLLVRRLKMQEKFVQPARATSRPRRPSAQRVALDIESRGNGGPAAGSI